MEERNPQVGPKPGRDVSTHEPPGVEGKLEPRADHGEESYRGSDRLQGRGAMIQAALPHLKPGIVILNTGSVTGLEGHTILIDYVATKGALHSLTKSLARSLSDRGGSASTTWLLARSGRR